MVMESLSGRLVQHPVERVVAEFASLSLLEFGQDLRLGRGEYAVETAQHRHGQHHPLVLRRAVRPAQQVGDVPNEVRVFLVVGHQSARKIESAPARPSKFEYTLEYHRLNGLRTADAGGDGPNLSSLAPN